MVSGTWILGMTALLVTSQTSVYHLPTGQSSRTLAVIWYTASALPRRTSCRVGCTKLLSLLASKMYQFVYPDKETWMVAEGVAPFRDWPIESASGVIVTSSRPLA